MGQIYGMDIDAVGELSQRMKTAAERLTSIRAEVDTALSHSHWEGPDANDFRNTWLFGWSGRLSNTAAVLDASAGTLGDNIDQQVNASTNSQSMASLAFYGFVKPAVTWLGYVESGVALTKGVAEDKSKHVPTAILKSAKWLDGQMPDLVRLDKVGGPLMSIAGIAVSGGELIHGLGSDPGSDETWNAGAETALAIGGAIALAAAPASLAVVASVIGAQFAYTVVEHFDPHVTEQIAHTTSVAAEDIWHGAQDGAGALADGAEDVIKGGFSLISKHLP